MPTINDMIRFLLLSSATGSDELFRTVSKKPFQFSSVLSLLSLKSERLTLSISNSDTDGIMDSILDF